MDKNKKKVLTENSICAILIITLKISIKIKSAGGLQMNWRKVSLLLGTAVMAAAMLSGCGKAADDPGGEAGEYSLYVGNAWMTTMFEAGKKDLVLQELEKKTGVSLNLELVKSADVDQEINIMLASGDLPDAILAGGATRTQMIQDGYIIPLDDLIEKNAPDMKKNLGFVFPEWRERDGSMYGLGCFVWNDPRYALNLTINTVQIRYDLLKELGFEKLDRTEPMQSFLTIGEYMELLDRVKETYPDLCPALFQTESAVEVLFKAKGLQCVRLPDSTYNVYEDGKAVSIFSSRYMPEVLTFLNDFQRNGYAPEGVTSYKPEEHQALLAQGKVFSTLGTVPGLDAANAMLSAENDEMRYVYFYLVESEDIKSVLINGYASAEGPNLMITKDCKDPEGLIKFLNYCSTEEGSTIIGAGIEGVTYTKEADGTLTPMEEIAKGYAMWDVNMIKKYGIGSWLNMLPAMEGLDENGNAYDINAQAAFTQDKWVMYNNKDWENFAYPRTINANAKIDSQSQEEAHEALSKISAYAFDRIAKAIARPDIDACMAEWNKCLEQMKADGLNALDQALAENWDALAKAYGRSPEKVFMTVAEEQDPAAASDGD